MRFLLLVCAAGFACLCAAAPARAQEYTTPPAYISFVQGTATVDHGDGSEPAVVNLPVLPGDRIRTANGRLDVTFPDGGSIEIDPFSEVEFLSETRVRVIAGAIEHRNAPAVDPRSQSRQYLPPDLRTYSPDFDQNGAWQYDPQYGTVWYPTTVAPDWRPYYYGYWAPVRTYGWTWIGYDRWSWPTHHYGRWGYARSRWFWIPGRTWSAAWVSWGTAPDYVSWCPLGYDDRPVIALSVWYGSNSWSRHPASYFDAWTVMRRDHFGARGYAANRYGVDPYRLASNTTFIEHRTPPSFDRRGSMIVAGSSRPGDNIVGVAVPRHEYRDPGSDPRVPGNAYRVPNPSYGDRTGGYDYRRRVPGTESRVPTPEQQVPGNEPRLQAPITPTPTLQQPTTGDHPAYRPRYQPRYEPTYDPGSSPWYRDRRMPSNDSRAMVNGPRPAEQRAEPREAMPAPAPRQPIAPRESSHPGHSGGVAPGAGAVQAPSQEHGGPPARTRSEGAQSSGTAVRRPR